MQYLKTTLRIERRESLSQLHNWMWHLFTFLTRKFDMWDADQASVVQVRKTFAYNEQNASTSLLLH